jgi:hypothetical protein
MSVKAHLLAGKLDDRSVWVSSSYQGSAWQEAHLLVAAVQCWWVELLVAVDLSVVVHW